VTEIHREGAGMSEPQWTPGPWRVQWVQLGDNDRRPGWLTQADDPYGRIISGFANPATVEAAANARLIAAAPELYAALSEMLRWLAQPPSGPINVAHVKERAEAALAKARGDRS